MADNVATSPRPTFHWLSWLAIFAFLVLASMAVWYVVENVLPRPLLVSKQTTYIVEPLRSDRTPDYERYVLERGRDGVTPENNAAVLLSQLFWPHELQGDDIGELCSALGITKIPSAEEGLRPFHGRNMPRKIRAWFAANGFDGDEAVFDVAMVAMRRAWTREQIPPFADWLQLNNERLNTIVDASRRTKYFMPSPTLLNDQHELLLDMDLHGIQILREAARSLALRAMWHLGEGRLEDAWSDALAIHRLAALAQQGHTLIEQLVATAVRGIACNCTLALLGDERLTLDLARQVQIDLDNVGSDASYKQALSELERLSAIDSVIHMSLYGVDAISQESSHPLNRSPIASSSNLDWNIVTSDLNRWYDQLADVCAQPTCAARREAWAKFESDLDDNGRSEVRPSRAIVALVSRSRRSTMIGSIMANLMLPALGAAISAEERDNNTFDLVRIAVALTVYRTEFGNYPDSLHELVPSILSQLPVDRFDSQPLVYQRDSDGFILYSIGANGQDDRGSNQDIHVLEGTSIDDYPVDELPDRIGEIPIGADDISIRVPRPLFQLPTPWANP
jgi:hypothetical protein